MPKFSRSHWGGAEESVHWLAHALVEDGFESEVWAPNTFGEHDVPSHANYRVRRFPGMYLSRSGRAKAGIGKAPMSPALLLALLRGPKPDVVHIHCHNQLAGFAVMAAALRAIPSVLTVHSRVAILRPRLRYWFSNEYALRGADHVISVAPYLHEAIRRSRPTGDISLIPNGVSAARFTGGRGTRFRESIGVAGVPLILCPGRICDVKNQAALVGALPRILDECPTAHLVLMGFVSEEGYLRELLARAERLGVTSRLRVVPGVDPQSRDLADAYAAADVVAVPSKSEASPLVVLEAWATGKPVVTSDAPGILSLVTPGRDGLVAPVDDEAALTGHLLEILQDPERARRLAEAGIEVARRHAWPEIAAQVADVYSRVLEQSPGS